MKILIVEDDPAHLKLADLVLSSAGHKIVTATSAEQAIQHVSGESPPEIILLDLGLPGADGLTLARKLRKAQATRHIPIVAVTAYPDRHPQGSALEAGCEAYIVKPIDTRKLAAQVEAVMRGNAPVRHVLDGTAPG